MTTQVEILQFLHYNPSSSRVKIAEALTNAPNERTLKRIIAECVQKGDIVVEGKGKATRYSLSAQAHLMMPLDIDTYFVNDVDERLVQESFNFQLICEILPNVTLFTAEEKVRLDAAHKNFLANMSTLSDFEYRKEMERLGVDLSWKSSQIEGNTYSLLETERLLKEKETAQGKTKEESMYYPLSAMISKTNLLPSAPSPCGTQNRTRYSYLPKSSCEQRQALLFPQQ